MIPDPTSPFEPQVHQLNPGHALYRVHSNRRDASEFNPGVGAPTRFAWFANEAGVTVPVLYAAATQEAAVAETLLHDIPAAGGILPFDGYADQLMSRIRVTRRLRLAVFHGLGLRRLKVTASQLTDSAASTYDRTVAWAKAAHREGLDGAVWMSRKCNDAHAYVFFDDRCPGAFEVDEGFGRVFATGADLMWLIELCAPLHVHVLPPPGRA